MKFNLSRQIPSEFVVEQEPPQLPEGIVDVDYTVISDDKGYILRNPDKCGIKDQWGILKVLVGERMTVSRSAGHCYAETADGIIALGSAYLAEDPRHVDDSILEPPTASARFRSATMRSRRRSW